mmetsp:Transcript_81137/g.161381  ORF Transcript_81137/g.161381 Transcript_81137/m.161381 type:complete len:110 (+) Transcript_81137:169-498(+)
MVEYTRSHKRSTQTACPCHITAGHVCARSTSLQAIRRRGMDGGRAVYTADGCSEAQVQSISPACISPACIAHVWSLEPFPTLVLHHVVWAGTHAYIGRDGIGHRRSCMA